MYNKKISAVFDSMSSKVALVLGRFVGENKIVVDHLKSLLKDRGYIPVVFDFEGPRNRKIGEVIGALAAMSRFIIADLSNSKSVPAELRHIVPALTSVPVLPIIRGEETEYALFEDIRPYPWVLDLVRYEDTESLSSGFDGWIISPLERWVEENSN